MLSNNLPHWNYNLERYVRYISAKLNLRLQVCVSTCALTPRWSYELWTYAGDELAGMSCRQLDPGVRDFENLS